VTVAGTTRSRLFLFAGLYFAQGVPWGFFTVAIMLRLATLGLGPAALGEIGSIAWLPWIAKPLLGPLVDRVSFGRFGRRRPYILIAELGMALSLLALSFADPISNLSLFGALLFVHNLFAAAQDVGTDALAIDILPERERGRANGFMSAGKFAGVLVGGQGMLLVARLAGWGVAYLVAIVLLLVPAALVLSARESEMERRPTRLVRDVVRLFSHRIVLAAALFAIVVDASDSFIFPLVYPLFTQQLHFSEQQVATLSTVGSAVAAVAAIAGGALSDRLGRRRTILIGCAGVAGFNVAFMLAHGLWGNYLFQLGFTAASAIASGIVYASILALFMDLAHPRLAATHFQVSMALLNVRSVWGSRVGGRLAERVTPTTMFGLGALIEIVPLALLLLLDPRKTRAAFAADAEKAEGASQREG
jgi:PAT family beta-lactamase induction signal transducer AmpG